MSDSLGTFCLVLHGHLPYVMHHGSSPHGTAWLYEAIAETYLPLLDLIGEIAINGVKPAITLGMTPVLLEQLASEDLKSGFVRYAQLRIEQAEKDQREFSRRGDKTLADLAVFWMDFYRRRLEHFERIGRDIPREFAARRAEGHIQILTGAATHAYLPLLLNDGSIRAQLAAGSAVTRKFFGETPTGIWLPECGYRPTAEAWRPPVLDLPHRPRPGIETFLPPLGLNHTFLDSHLIVGGKPLGIVVEGRFFSAEGGQTNRDRNAGWRDVLEPVGIRSEQGWAEVFALARHPSVAQQVWSSKVGYPGDGNYLDFHKKHLPGGLRYWRVTDVAADLASKAPYSPSATQGTVYAHAQHFCSLVKQALSDHRQRTGRRGVCVAAFDAELFGHWWFEGIRFLRDVLLTMAHDDSLQHSTAEEALRAFPPDKIMRPAEGSWGRHGDHTVWFNDANKWMWEVEYRAEQKFFQRLGKLPWQSNKGVADAMKWGARELLLLQSSDWPFLVEGGAALDYSNLRFSGHAVRFERAVDMARDLAEGNAPTPRQVTQLAEMKAHDNVFEEIDLNWWAG